MAQQLPVIGYTSRGVQGPSAPALHPSSGTTFILGHECARVTNQSWPGDVNIQRSGHTPTIAVFNQGFDRGSDDHGNYSNVIPYNSFFDTHQRTHDGISFQRPSTSPVLSPPVLCSGSIGISGEPDSDHHSYGMQMVVDTSERETGRNQGFHTQTTSHVDDRDQIAQCHSRSPSSLQQQMYLQLRAPYASGQVASRTLPDHLSAVPIHVPISSSAQSRGGLVSDLCTFPENVSNSATTSVVCPGAHFPHAVYPPFHLDHRMSSHGNACFVVSERSDKPSPILPSRSDSESSHDARHSASITFWKDGESSSSMHAAGPEMKTDEWHSAAIQAAANSMSMGLPSVQPVPDAFGHDPMAPTSSSQSSSSSPIVQQPLRHLRRWSSANVGSTTSSRFPAAFHTAGQPHITRLRRHSQADTSPPFSHRFISKGSSQSPSPRGQISSLPVTHQLHPTIDSSTGDTVSPSSSTNGSVPTRQVAVCDGHFVDEESLHNTLQKPDKLLHVYECFWDREHSSCGMWIEGDQPSIADHLQHFHGFKGGETTTRCLWHDCPKPNMKGTSIARHVVTHVGFRIKCDTCKHEFARGDACNRAHSRSHCTGVGQPMYGELQRVLDARKVDLSRRPMKKRRLEE